MIPEEPSRIRRLTPSRHTQVPSITRAAEPLRRATAHALGELATDPNFAQGKGSRLLALTPKQLVEHLVDLRGELHHHSLRKPGVWHPDKAHLFQEEALLLMQIVHHIAMAHSHNVIFDSQRNSDLMKSARAAGMLTSLQVEVTALIKGNTATLPPIRFHIPTSKPNRAAINTVHHEFRRRFRGTPEGELLKYKMVSDDGRRVFAVWERK
jgi:hypothetical protein